MEYLLGPALGPAPEGWAVSVNLKKGHEAIHKGLTFSVCGVGGCLLGGEGSCAEESNVALELWQLARGQSMTFYS